MLLKTKAGIEVEVVQEIDIGGNKYLLVDPKSGKYSQGILVRYYLCPANQFEMRHMVRDKVEVVEVEKESTEIQTS